jgi:hypothetical protein
MCKTFAKADVTYMAMKGYFNQGFLEIVTISDKIIIISDNYGAISGE